MGTPRKPLTSKSTTSTQKKRVPKPKKKCSACPPERANQTLDNFFRSHSELNSDGYLSVCKTCIKERCYDADIDEVDVEALKNLLRQIDRPYIEKIYQASVGEYYKRYPKGSLIKEDKSKVISYYFKSIQTLKQYSKMTWEDGLFWEEKENTRSINGIIQTRNKLHVSKHSQFNDDEIYSLDEKDFEVTEDIIRLFGNGFKKREYKAMWDKYQFLRNNYSDVTNLHVEALVTYVRFKVKEEFATARGDVAEADKWHKAATSASEKAKINPSQLSKSDLQGGLNSFAELLQAVEQAIDVIPILPKFKYRPNDSIDFIIWCLINYLRKLEGKHLCEYEDVYKFYDERKDEYIEQYGDPYGIFIDDTTELNRESIKKFILLPEDYCDTEEPVENDEGDAP